MDIISFLKQFDLSKVKEFEEEFDEQFKALKYLYENMKRKECFISLCLMNALSCYMLKMRGEEYWWKFAKYFTKDFKDELEEIKFFIRIYNPIFAEIKIKRIEKAYPLIKKINENAEFYYKNMLKLWNELGKFFDKKSKTVCFAIKIFGYACRIKFGYFISFPFEIPIPVDRRIKEITEKITKEDPIKFWYKVSKEVNIPPLHIDSILWVKYKDILKLLELGN